MTPSTQEALKPCPFCNGDDILISDNVEVWGQGSDQVYARCDSCGANGPSAYTDQTALTKWNTRATFQPGGERREAIARTLWLSRGGLSRIWDELKSSELDYNRPATISVFECWRDAGALLASGLVQDEAGIPDGFALVPIKPTSSMIEAGCENNPTQWNEDTDLGFSADVANDVYVAMVNAAIRSARDGGAET